MHSDIVNRIKIAIERGEHISPFLFLCSNISAAQLEVQSYISELQNIYGLPSSYIVSLDNDEESVKIAQTRAFIEKSLIKADYKIQIFVIENISRLTLGSGNSLLKFFEEPGEGNIIFLTNRSESNVLETILSRVQSIQVESLKKQGTIQYIERMIQQYVENDNTEILSYYYTKQIEQSDAFDFLYALIDYIKQGGKFSALLKQIDRDMCGLGNNNFLPKYIIDSYLIQLKLPL